VRPIPPAALNHVDQIVHDWGWWNRAYTRLLLRARGYRLVSMARTLPEVGSIAELSQHEHGALFRLEPRQSLHDFQAPTVVLGEHAPYVLDYYKREFAPRQDRPFIAYFKNPVLYGRQFSILESGRAFAECFTRDRRWREGVPKNSRPLKPRKIPGTFLLAGTEFHNHFAHLFCDVLPHWKLFEEAGLTGQLPAILPPPSHAYAADAWQMLGLTGNGALEWDDGSWQMDGLYFASSFKKFCSWTPEAADWIRAKLVPDVTQSPRGKKAFYISRSGTARAILNENEIIRALEPYGVTVVQPEKLSLTQQMELFSEAGLIVGPHGAGIQNALWAPRGCRMLELVNVRYFSGVYWTLAESLGHPYGLVTGNSVTEKDPTWDTYTCDYKLVRQAVERLS
jgi:Glycosyltransferase 61